MGLVILFNMGLVIGLIMVANSADGGKMSEQNPFVLSIPFLVGAIGFGIVVTHWCLRCCWQVCKNTKRKSQFKKMENQVQGGAGAVTITTKAVRQLVRTTSAMPQVNALP